MSKLDLSALLKTVSDKRAAIEARSGKNNIQKPPMGKSRWRILPGWRPEEPLVFSHDFAQHWIKEPNPAGGEPILKGVFVCDDKTFGQPCDACAQISAIRMGMKSAGLVKESAPFKMIDEMASGLVTLVNALRTDGAQKSDQPIMLGLGTTAFSAYLALLALRAEEGRNILELETGKDIIIERTGSGFDTKYSVTDVSEPTSIDPVVMTKLVNIDAYVEAERQKGASKTGLLAPAARAVLTLAAGHSSTVLIPSAASLVPARAAPSRIIEADEVPFATAPVAAAVAAAPAAAPAPAAVATPAPAAAVPDVSSDLLADDELKAMLAGL